MGEAALSALFEEFRTPGIAVFEKNGCTTSVSSLVLTVSALLMFLY